MRKKPFIQLQPRPIPAIMVLTVFCLLGLLIFTTRPKTTLPRIPIPITGAFTEQFLDPQAQYPPVVQKKLAISDDQLIPLRCSEKFIRNWEAQFFLQNTKNRKYSIGMDNDAMINFISRIEQHVPNPYAQNKKFLLGRLCETEDGLTFFEYHAGKQQQIFDDFTYLGTDINSMLIVAHKNKDFSTSINMTGKNLGPFLTCNPMQITKAHLLLYQCTVITPQKAITSYHEYDLSSSTRNDIAECIFSYENGKSMTCKEK